MADELITVKTEIDEQELLSAVVDQLTAVFTPELKAKVSRVLADKLLDHMLEILIKTTISPKQLEKLILPYLKLLEIDSTDFYSDYQKSFEIIDNSDGSSTIQFKDADWDKIGRALEFGTTKTPALKHLSPTDSFFEEVEAEIMDIIVTEFLNA